MKHILLSLSLAFLYLSSSAQFTVLPINPSGNGSNVSRLTEFKGKLVFFAYDDDHGTELWELDSAGIRMVFDINPGVLSSITAVDNYKMAVANNTLYFLANDGSSGIELFAWDGTNAPYLVHDIIPGIASSALSNAELISMGNKIYFAANTPAYGIELWRHDPVTKVTQRLADIYVGANSSFPSHFTVYNNMLYFAATSATSGRELYVYDPMTNATTLAQDIYVGGASSNLDALVVIQNKLYFTAITNANGRELHSYDGKYLKRLTDLNPNANSSFTATASGDNTITEFNGEIYMIATDGVVPNNLYKYSPATGKTTLVYKINTVGSSQATSLTRYGFALYFAANDGVNGKEVWKYDGVNPPSMFANIEPAATNSLPANFTVYNHELYITAYTGAVNELLKYVDQDYKDSMLTVKNVTALNNISVFPNPATTQASISVSLDKEESLNIVLTSVEGKVLYTTGSQEYSSGQHAISIPVQSLAAGMYFYTVTNGEGVKHSGRLLKQ